MRAWVVLGDFLLLLVALSRWVPSPPSLAQAIGSVAAGERSGVAQTWDSAIDQALMLVAGVLVWFLLAWFGSLMALGLLVRLCGTPALTRAVIDSVAPRALRGLLIGALGVGTVAGMTGCAPSPGSDPLSAAAVVTISVGELVGGPAAGQLDLDWPSLDGTSAGGTGANGTTADGTPADGTPTNGTTADGTAADGLWQGTDTAVTTGEWSVETQPIPAPIAVDLDWPVAPASVAPASVAPASVAPASVATDTSLSTAPTSEEAGSTGTSVAVSVAAPELTPTTPAPTTPTAPTAPTATEAGAAAAISSSTDDAPTTVTVRAGDTLWSLAASELGPGATSAEIAARWPQWYQANRAVIGDNPDHLLPGWELTVPHNQGATA